MNNVEIFVHTGYHPTWQHRPIYGVYPNAKAAEGAKLKTMVGNIQRRRYIQIDKKWYRVNVVPELNETILAALKQQVVREEYSQTTEMQEPT